MAFARVLYHGNEKCPTQKVMPLPQYTDRLPKVPPERTVCPANVQERVQSYGGGQQTALVTSSPIPTSGGSSICHILAFTSI